MGRFSFDVQRIRKGKDERVEGGWGRRKFPATWKADREWRRCCSFRLWLQFISISHENITSLHSSTFFSPPSCFISNLLPVEIATLDGWAFQDAFSSRTLKTKNLPVSNFDANFCFFSFWMDRPAARRWWLEVKLDHHRRIAVRARVRVRLLKGRHPLKENWFRPPSIPKLRRAEVRPRRPLPPPSSWTWRWCRITNIIYIITTTAKWPSLDLFILTPLTALPHLPSTLPVSFRNLFWLFFHLFILFFIFLWNCDLVQFRFPIFFFSLRSPSILFHFIHF